MGVNYTALKHGACSCAPPRFRFESGGCGINTRYDRLIDCSPADVLRRDVVGGPGEPARHTGKKTLAFPVLSIVPHAGQVRDVFRGSTPSAVSPPR